MNIFQEEIKILYKKTPLLKQKQNDTKLNLNYHPWIY